MSVVVYNCRRLVKHSPQCLRVVSRTWLGSSRKREYSVPETSTRTVFLDCIFARLLKQASSCERDVLSMPLAVGVHPSTTVLHKPADDSLSGSRVCLRRC